MSILKPIHVLPSYSRRNRMWTVMAVMLHQLRGGIVDADGNPVPLLV